MGVKPPELNEVEQNVNAEIGNDSESCAGLLESTEDSNKHMLVALQKGYQDFQNGAGKGSTYCSSGDDY